jgi:AcrR family transcriptional regulator
LSIEGSAIHRLETVVDHVVGQSFRQPHIKCLIVSALCEFGNGDSDIHAVNERIKKTLHNALIELLSEAQEAGDLRKEIDVALAAECFAIYFLGAELAARGGATQERLHAAGRLIISCLQRPLQETNMQEVSR